MNMDKYQHEYHVNKFVILNSITFANVIHWLLAYCTNKVSFTVNKYAAKTMCRITPPKYDGVRNLKFISYNIHEKTILQIT